MYSRREITMRIDAKPERPLDVNKLRNAVEEPLDELGVLKKDTEEE